MNGVGFRARARTIDHLGRGQIADAPTAVSELWKNAYDAYARNVALHIFDGDPEVAAVFDDGVGMDRADLVSRWLVIGTETKIEDGDTVPIMTFGLPHRSRQGEKGIGRLSAAFLAPATVLASRKLGSCFVAVVVDWRLFENPFIDLEDILLPVGEFDGAEALAAGLPGMVDLLSANLGSDDDDRTKRLAVGWERFTAFERKRGTAPTVDAIKDAWKAFPIGRRHLEEWPVFLNLVPHGTAMFMPDIHRELNVWVRPDEAGEEVDEVHKRLRETLTAFTDPFSEPKPDFDYEALVHRRGRISRIVGTAEVFGIDDLHGLEHFIDGAFDDQGIFTGKVTAFGEDLGIKEYVPRSLPASKGRDLLGPFKFAIGTFEQDPRRSTHSEQQHAHLMMQAEAFGGVRVYRDGLRIMPYGRVDADFLRLEERRSKHAGRYFWAHRRSFGRVAFTRENNPNLRDKAGREGLVDNRANREMRILLTELLVDFAASYFGSSSDLRRDLLPGIMERNAAAKAAANQAKVRRRRGFREFLKEQSRPLEETLRSAVALEVDIERIVANADTERATVLAYRVDGLRSAADALRPPQPPAKLGDLEEAWRTYRDDYQELLERVGPLAARVAEIDANLGGLNPSEVLRRRAETLDAALAKQIGVYGERIEEAVQALLGVWRTRQEEDRHEYGRRIQPLLAGNGTPGSLISSLNLLDAHRVELVDAFAGRYPPIIATLDQLAEGTDIEGAYAATEDERSELEDRLRDLQAVAQVGVTVEIIGHEFETLEAEVRRNLAKLPAQCRQTPAYAQAIAAHQGLADRLRFLAPMRIGGYRSRERITGGQIADYVSEFFGRAFTERHVDFAATRAFRSLAITDLPSRIYPVFVNLVNNALYWVSRASEREIIFDLSNKLVVVADSGPGVDPDDLPRLFELFFTKRTAGRGVGLYLTRANLAVAGHRIRYAREDDPHVLRGANFIIEFRGLIPND